MELCRLSWHSGEIPEFKSLICPRQSRLVVDESHMVVASHYRGVIASWRHYIVNRDVRIDSKIPFKISVDNPHELLNKTALAYMRLCVAEFHNTHGYFSLS